MTTQIATREEDAFTLPDKARAESKLTAIAQFQEVVHRTLIEGHDYGIIPGTGNKPTLLKPGAEKIIKLMELADTYTVLAHEDWDKPLFHYLVTCRLSMIANGKVVAEGIGECNSMESKYRYRWEGQGDGRKRVVNEDIFSLVNTLLKMAKKRALVDAALSAGRLSDLFTQDLDERQEDAPTPPRRQNQPAGTPEAGTPDLCPTHNVAYFKTGNMRGYAHKIANGGWCNAPRGYDPSAKPAPTAQPTDTDMYYDWKQSVADGFSALSLNTPADMTKWLQVNCPLLPTSSKDWKPADWETASNTMSNYLAGLAKANAAHGAPGP